MSEISVTPEGGGYCVRVADGSITTEHVVTVPDAIADRLGVDPSDSAATEGLVRASFEFLLEREPASAIYREFSLEVISRYFPDYEAAIVDRLA